MCLLPEAADFSGFPATDMDQLLVNEVLKSMKLLSDFTKLELVDASVDLNRAIVREA